MLAGMLRVLSDPVPVIPRSDVPAELQRVLERAMAKDPGQRWPSAGEFGRALQSVERDAGRPVTRMPTEEVHESRLTPPEEMTGAGGRDRIRSGGSDSETALTPFAPRPKSDPSVATDSAALAGQPDERTRRWSWRPAPPVPRPDPEVGNRKWPWALMRGRRRGHGHRGRDRPDHPDRLAQVEGHEPHAAPADAIAGPGVGAGARQVEVVDEQPTSVSIHWVDPSHGVYPFVVRVSNGVVRAAVTHTQAVVTGLVPTKGYCFVVGAVYGVGGQVANASPVCVRGGTM